jgi:hypothetical protein
LLVDDVRRVETKKPLGRKARKIKQRSKRWKLLLSFFPYLWKKISWMFVVGKWLFQ